MTRRTWRFYAVLLAAIFALATILVGGKAANAESIKLSGICFDGDSTYDWAHFYYVDGLTGSIKDLNITVLDQDHAVVSPDLYDLTIYHYWYDEGLDQEMMEEVQSPYSIASKDRNDEIGFTEFRAVAVMKNDVENNVSSTFYIMDTHSLNWICADVSFKDQSKKDGWRMCDRFWVDISKLQAPVVKAGGKVLKEGTDFEVMYFTRSGDMDSFDTDRDKILAGDTKLSGLPTKAGEYVLHIIGLGDYYGECIVLLDVEGTAEPDYPQKLEPGWTREGNLWYYVDDDGDKATGWQYIDKKWYYFDNAGWMQTGWQQISGKWYFLKNSGAMALNEWCNGYWLSKNGAWTYKAKGSWRKDSKGWWFGDTRKWYAKNQWQLINGKWYYFNAAGYMVTGTQTIGGKTYTFDASGAWVK